MKILVINGPNLNMLGIREPELYGKKTYSDLISFINKTANENGHTVECFQSNHEGAIIDKIQSAYKNYDALIINAGAYTHTSLAIADAIKAVGITSIEVHLTDISKRESYRQFSFLKDVCVKTIAGYGFDSYKKAIEYFE